MGKGRQKAQPDPTPESRARVLHEALSTAAIDVVTAARASQAIFAEVGDLVRARWLDLELNGYGVLSSTRPLHEILGLPVEAPLTIEVATYRTQVGRRWGEPRGESKVAHFFVEPLAELIAARDHVRDASVTGLVELSFASHPSAPGYPKSADFPADVFDRILLGFASALGRELEDLAP